MKKNRIIFIICFFMSVSGIYGMGGGSFNGKIINQTNDILYLFDLNIQHGNYWGPGTTPQNSQLNPGVPPPSFSQTSGSGEINTSFNVGNLEGTSYCSFSMTYNTNTEAYQTSFSQVGNAYSCSISLENGCSSCPDFIVDYANGSKSKRAK